MYLRSKKVYMEAIIKLIYIQTQHVKTRKNIKYTIELKIFKSYVCTLKKLIKR